MEKISKKMTFAILGISVIVILSILTYQFPRNKYSYFEKNQINSNYSANSTYRFLVLENSKIKCGNDEVDIKHRIEYNGYYNSDLNSLKIYNTNCTVKAENTVKLDEEVNLVNQYSVPTILDRNQLKQSLIDKPITDLSGNEIFTTNSKTYDEMNIEKSIIGQSKDFIYLQIPENILRIKQTELNKEISQEIKNKTIIPKLSEEHNEVNKSVSFNEFLLINSNIIEPKNFTPELNIYSQNQKTLSAINIDPKITIRNNLNTQTLNLTENQKYISNSFENNFDKLFFVNELTPEIEKKITETNAKIYIVGDYKGSPQNNVTVIK